MGVVSLRTLVWIGLGLAIAALGYLRVASDGRQAASNRLLNTTPYKIAVLTSSDRNRCFKPGVVTAIQHFTKQEARRINRAGGIGGVPLELLFLDDFATGENTIKNVDKVLGDPRLIGIIGINSSTRGRGVVDAIGGKGVPLVSEMSRDDFYAAYPSLFSIAIASQNEIDLITQFLKNKKFKRPAYIGFEGDLYAAKFRTALKDAASDPAAFIDREFVGGASSTLDEAKVDAVVDELKTANADVVFLAIHSKPGAQFIGRMRAADLKTPVFIILGRIARMRYDLGINAFDRDMFELAREGIPSVLNERLRQRIWKNQRARWTFDDTRRENAPKECLDPEKFKDPIPVTGIEDRRNRRSIGRGIQYRDILALMAQSGRPTDIEKRNVPPDEMRKRIVRNMARLMPDKKVYRGWWQDWAFTPRRSTSADQLLVFQPAGARASSLAPEQYVVRSGRVVPVPVGYIGLDMKRVFDVDSNAKTFNAEFYVSLQSDSALSLDNMEFSNAFRSQATNRPSISVRRIQDSTLGRGRANDIRLYKINGKFTFDPDLSNYPFDRQRFSISLQPKTTSSPFFIQPLPKELRVKAFDADGWRIESEYVGSDRDIIAVTSPRASSVNILPLDKFNFTWTMKRIATDYYLQVIVPLVVILLVTYLSIFIPSHRLEPIVSLQVTALLSAIALYLAVPKVSFESATTSDVVFVTTYMAISVTLGFSIWRASSMAQRRDRTRFWLGVAQFVVLPLVVLGMVDYVAARSLGAEGSTVQLVINEVVRWFRTTG